MEDGFAQGYAVGKDSSNNNSGFGFGGDWAWIILLLVLCGNNGFGGSFGGGGGGGNSTFPWLLQGQTNTDNNVNAGFANAALSGKLDSIQETLHQNAIDNLQTAYGNQIAGMQQNFAMQQAFANCCCENRLGIADLKATVIQENCADREALSNGIRDIISNNTAGVQRILDQLCADKIDAKNEKIAELQRQLQMADLKASQIAQTAQIREGQVAEIDAMYNRLKGCPVGTVPVYGSQPIFTCPINNSNNNGCGCGNNF